jgi:hypothetical protein
VVRDRAKALIQRAEQGLACLSMPDFFHLVHDIVKSYSLARGRRLKQARHAWHRATDRLQKHLEREPQGHAVREAMDQVAANQAEVTRWEAIPRE